MYLEPVQHDLYHGNYNEFVHLPLTNLQNVDPSLYQSRGQTIILLTPQRKLNAIRPSEKGSERVNLWEQAIRIWFHQKQSLN